MIPEFDIIHTKEKDLVTLSIRRGGILSTLGFPLLQALRQANAIDALRKNAPVGNPSFVCNWEEWGFYGNSNLRMKKSGSSPYWAN